MHQVASAAWHAVAIGYAVFIACSTALPTGTNIWFFVFDVETLITPRFVGKLVVVSALVGGLVLALLAWRRRHLWTARLSLPLLGYMAACGIGLAMLVVLSQPPRYLARFGLGELRAIAEDLDVRHMISYFGFAVVAAIAWRGRVSLPILGVVLMAYGYCLELSQEFVPTRNFRVKDLVSNGLGLLLGFCWVYLYDTLFGAQGTGLSRWGRWSGRRRPATRAATEASIQPRGS